MWEWRTVGPESIRCTLFRLRALLLLMQVQSKKIEGGRVTRVTKRVARAMIASGAKAIARRGDKRELI